MKGNIKLCYLSTDKNVADGLTKGLSKDKHYKFMSLMKVKC